ncbi:MAG: pullulanase-type alpha-1,6-glucosidase [Aggregatilineales bacterium]
MITQYLVKHPRLALHIGTLLAAVVLLISAIAPSISPVLAAPSNQNTPNPTSVTVAGTIQSKVGCAADWKPDCDKTFLKYDTNSDVWHTAFTLPAGDYEYKAALNGNWTENYGAQSKSGGANIPLKVAKDGPVNFFYDHKTHWITDDQSSPIAAVIGDFQTKLGCSADNDPVCLRGWLEDPQGKSVYSFTTTLLPAGTYNAKVALDLSADQIYGKDGAKGGDPIQFTVAHDKDEIYFVYDPTKHLLTVHPEGAPHGDLSKAQAIWVARDTIAWKLQKGYVKGATYALYYDPTASMTLTPAGITNGQSIPLTYNFGGLNTKLTIKWPELYGYNGLTIGKADLDKVPDILKGQLIAVAFDANGKLMDATTVQVWGVLDDLFTYNGKLGITYLGDSPTLSVWAPTAQSVTLHLYDDSKATADKVVPMNYSPINGVWSAVGEASWTNKFYLYEVKVYTRATGKVEDNFVTDPYSISLAMNSTRSQIVNLADPALMPDGWANTPKPALNSPTDIVIYELHIRDFSIGDQTVPQNYRGTYMAFTVANSDGMKHLKALTAAGLTHVHLMPAFDFTSVNEDPAQRIEPDASKLASFPPDSDQQQALISPLRDLDGFNWGYDPYHYTTPEGSYSTNPDGSTRILEFRKMVQALNQAGLRVVMDVVYNHTAASGQNQFSVLDKIVPGYYYRYDADGVVETSTCCQNTATEHAMMEKLMVDSVVTWATAYKVDSFRFDLMGHHMVSNMLKVRDTLVALTVAKDGVDGSKIYLYGEGWDFGEVGQNARGKNATQLNLTGTGIGTFNDRLRDGGRGGSPFSDLRDQGFLTGLYTDPNAYENGQLSADKQKAQLLHETDWIRIGMAGNLKDYVLTDATGKQVKGSQIDYGGAPTGYTLAPQENIVYVSAHDNQSLFDAIQMKAPADADIKARVRMQNLGADVVLLSQGVPFFLAGDNMLRSKSLDGNSYNSGDWFNKLDWTLQSNNFGVGLPQSGDNGSNWPIMKPLLANPALKPAPADIQFAVAHFEEMLKIRKSSPLFRLTTAQDVSDRLKFYNVGPDQIPGVIMLSLSDTTGTQLDANYAQIVVVINATPQSQTIGDPTFATLAFTLHPVQAASIDPIVQTAKYNPTTSAFTVPARTTAVFVLPRTVK